MHKAEQASSISRVFVATDDHRIAEVVEQHGGTAILTSPTAKSGTDRVAEAAARFDASIIVNVQGDEPLIEPSTIDAAIRPLIDDPSLLVSTTSEPIDTVDDVLNPNVVKVVTDRRGFGLYFSRSPLPYPRGGRGNLEETLRSDSSLLSRYRKHTGLYAYRRSFLDEFSRMDPTPLEITEGLEQLRMLENGHKIKVVEVEHRSIGIDTEQDYYRVKKLIEESIK